MEHLIPLMKQIEIELKAGMTISKENWNELAELSDWEYRIMQDFMLRVNLYQQNNNSNFVYKFYQKNINEFTTKQSNFKIDILIVSLKRSKTDLVLTDIYNRMPLPQNLTSDYLEIWGEQVTRGRNFAVKEAMRRNATYLLFIDDDIIAPQGGIQQLFQTMEKTDSNVVAGQYYRKMKPLMSAHGNLTKDDTFDNVYKTDLCAMGFVLMNIDYLTRHIPIPLFWEFGAPDGYWSMGEDAFFTRNMIEHIDEKPIVDTSISLLHYDKTWKKIYGHKDNDVVYATNAIDNFEQFETLRAPNKYPLIAVATPLRTQNDPIAVDLTKMLLLRGYRTDPIKCHGLRVDDARTELASHALQMDADYLLFIDNDITPPSDGLCRLLEIMESDKENKIGCISGDYYLKGSPTYSAHLQLDDDGMVKELDRVIQNNSMVESNWLIGLGFVLIRTDFFKQARKPWFKCHTRNQQNIDINEDAHFSELMFENGYKIIIDMQTQCLHVDFENKQYYGYSDNIDLKQYAGFEWLSQCKYISYQKSRG